MLAGPFFLLVLSSPECKLMSVGGSRRQQGGEKDAGLTFFLQQPQADCHKMYAFNIATCKQVTLTFKRPAMATLARKHTTTGPHKVALLWQLTQTNRASCWSGPKFHSKTTVHTTSRHLLLDTYFHLIYFNWSLHNQASGESRFF